MNFRSKLEIRIGSKFHMWHLRGDLYARKKCFVSNKAELSRTKTIFRPPINLFTFTLHHLWVIDYDVTYETQWNKYQVNHFKVLAVYLSPVWDGRALNQLTQSDAFKIICIRYLQVFVSNIWKFQKIDSWWHIAL